MGSAINMVGGQTVMDSTPPTPAAVKNTGVFNWHHAFTFYALLRAFLYFLATQGK